MSLTGVFRAFYAACVFFWLFITINSIARPAYAYVDPGTGLFAIQVLGSTFAAMTFMLRKRIRGFLTMVQQRFHKSAKDLPRSSAGMNGSR